MNAKAVSFLMDEYCKSQDLSERVFLPEILKCNSFINLNFYNLN